MNVRWLWVVLVLILLLPLILGVYEKNVDQKGITMLLLSSLFAGIPVAGILLYSKLQIRIDGEGLHYKFFPSVWKWKLISTDQIDSFELSAKKTLLEKLECGYRRNRLTNTIVMNITGEKFIRIKLKDGKRLKIGSENPEAMEWALKRLTTQDTIN
jgi:hypothetical protein